MSYKQNVEAEFWGMIMAIVIIVCVIGSAIAGINLLMGLFQ